MKVFISWSGEQTKDLAHALKEFLDTVFAGHVHTFMSDADVAPGDRFLAAINSNLDLSDLGLLLVTRTNQSAPWLLFEAGALAGKSEKGSVIPILVDLERVDLRAPLSQFQNVIGASSADFEKLWARIHADSGGALSQRALGILLKEAWPALREAVAAAAAAARPEGTPRASRSTEDMLGEILLAVNALVRREHSDSPWAGDERHAPRPLLRPSARDNGDLQLHRGQRISHEDFGVGEVVAVTGVGDRSIAHVEFERVGRKKLLVKIAPIEVLST